MSDYEELLKGRITSKEYVQRLRRSVRNMRDATAYSPDPWINMHRELVSIRARLDAVYEHATTTPGRPVTIPGHIRDALEAINRAVMTLQEPIDAIGKATGRIA